MDLDKCERVSETDPERCTGIVKGGSLAGQCTMRKVPGSVYCYVHGGFNVEMQQKKHGLRNYQLQKYGERVGQLANSPEIKSLREEIGITRMMLEGILNKLDNTNQLLIYSEKITGMVGQIQRLVEAAQKMEERNNNLLDRKVVIVIADSITTIIAQYITDPDVLLAIGEKVCESIITAGASSTDKVRAIA